MRLLNHYAITYLKNGLTGDYNPKENLVRYRYPDHPGEVIYFNRGLLDFQYLEFFMCTIELIVKTRNKRSAYLEKRCIKVQKEICQIVEAHQKVQLQSCAFSEQNDGIWICFELISDRRLTCLNAVQALIKKRIRGTLELSVEHYDEPIRDIYPIEMTADVEEAPI